MKLTVTNCDRCDDTGSLSRNLHGSLDCGYCDTATERVALERWVGSNAPLADGVDAWLIYQHGKAAAAK